MNNKFGRYLVELREQKNISARKLAKSINISYSHISNIENGRRSPNKETIINISNYLDLRIEERIKLFDLAAIDHTRINNIPDDISDYIQKNNCSIRVIRLAENLRYTNVEWNEIIDYMSKKP